MGANNKRIVISGLGVLSPLGRCKEEFWDRLKEGKNCFSPIDLFNTDNFKVKKGGIVCDFNPKDILKTRVIDLDRAVSLILCASKFAIEDGRLSIDERNADDIGVSVGTVFGSIDSIYMFQKDALIDGPRFANPTTFLNVVCNSPASRVSIYFKPKGFNTTISTGECAGLDALAYARDFIVMDRAEKVIAGAVNDFSYPLFLGLYKNGCLAGIKGEFLSCPFDYRRNGIILSEGAGMVLIEKEDSALEEKRNIYGEILGVGQSFNYSGKKYSWEGMVSAMSLALQNAGLSISDIDCIFVNANSTQEADYLEYVAINNLFGEQAERVFITGIKSILGEPLSAWGVLGVIAGLGAINRGFIPPTGDISLDEKIKIDIVKDVVYKDVDTVMVNAFDYTGMNTSIIIGRYKK